MSKSLRSMLITPLSEMQNGQVADLFALLSSKEEQKTRDGKLYFRVTFRDAARAVSFPIWADSPWALACRDEWTPGECYKIRGQYRETEYGPQLEIEKIRPATPADTADGFDPTELRPHSRFPAVAMFDQLCDLVQERIACPPLARLVLAILVSHRDTLLTLPAAKHHHHAFLAGFLEHVLSVTRTAVFFADKYDDYYPDLSPRLDKDLVVAGAVLHDIGKVRELALTSLGTDYTPAGHLIGHILQGRDIVLEQAARQEQEGHPLDAERLLRLEHMIISHQRLPEWGSPKPPMTPEALLVHYADDLDAKYHMVYQALRDDKTAGPLTSPRNFLEQRLYRGG